MAGSQVDKSSAIGYLQAQVLGYEAVTTTKQNANYYDPTVTQYIKAGSIIEISGELYKFASDEAITLPAFTVNTIFYVKFVPSGTTCTVATTATAPTWNEQKNGFYDGNDRYLFNSFMKFSNQYTGFRLMDKSNCALYIESGSGASAMTRQEFYNIVSPYLTSVQDGVKAEIYLEDSTASYFVKSIKRQGATRIDIVGIRFSMVSASVPNIEGLPINSTDTTLTQVIGGIGLVSTS